MATPGGWAEILIDGQRAGRSPLRLTLPAGPHRVELRPFGELPARTSRVNVEAGDTTRLVVRLSP